jgi:hypothetical protein
VDSSLEAEVVSLLEQGQKIGAIKVYREQTGAGLKEAKEAVEAIAADRRIIAPSGSGCLGVLLFLVAIIAGMAAVHGAQARPQHDEQGLERSDEADLDDLVSQMQELGLRITADQKKISAATSEAAYFMFADRKDHRPKCRPFKLPEEGQWLEGKPVFTDKADRKRIFPLFRKLVEKSGYNEVCIYDADVHYGVSSYADFTLYKLGYIKDDPRRGKKAEVLLGDADYVMKLP